MESPELLFRRFGELGGIVDEKLQLLGEAPADDRVTLGETHLLGLSRQQLFIDELIDETSHLVGRRFAQPLAGPGLPEPVDISFGDADRNRRAVSHLLGVQPCIRSEQDCAGDGEVQQRFLQERHGYRDPRPEGPVRTFRSFYRNHKIRRV